MAFSFSFTVIKMTIKINSPEKCDKNDLLRTSMIFPFPPGIVEGSLARSQSLITKVDPMKTNLFPMIAFGSPMAPESKAV